MKIEQIKTIYDSRGYSWPKGLHFFGVRNPYKGDDQFNDELYIIRNTQTDPTFVPCTLWPGRGHLRKMLNSKGTAVIKEGQYLNLWTLGKHHGSYEALVQVSPIAVHRDNNKDDRADLSNVIDRGIFGINLHRANSKWTSKVVDLWSAGCVVVPDPAAFNALINTVKMFADQRYFTFTLYHRK